MAKQYRVVEEKAGVRTGRTGGTWETKEQAEYAQKAKDFIHGSWRWLIEYREVGPWKELQ